MKLKTLYRSLSLARTSSRRRPGRPRRRWRSSGTRRTETWPAGRRAPAAAAAGQPSSVWSHACLSSTPTARDSAGLVSAGMFWHSTLPLSITSSRGGSRRVTAAVSASAEDGGADGPAGEPACSLAGLGGQKVAATSGRSKTERKTLRPSMMLERSFASMVSQSCAYQRFTASSRSRRAGSAGARPVDLERDSQLRQRRRAVHRAGLSSHAGARPGSGLVGHARSTTRLQATIAAYDREVGHLWEGQALAA